MKCVCRQNYICICNNIHMTLVQCVRRGIYIFTYKKRWMKIHKSMSTYTKLQVERLFIYIPITLLWKCTPDSTPKLHSRLHAETPLQTPRKTPLQTPHQNSTPDSSPKLHSRLHANLHSRLHHKTPLQTPHQNSTPNSKPKLHSRLHAKTPHQNSTTKLHSRLHNKTPLFKLHGDVSLPFRGIRVN